MGDRITFSGLSTGIDFQAIIDATMLAERRRIELVEANQAEQTAKLTLVQGFNALLLGLLNSTSSLAKDDLFQTQAVTSSNESLVTASVTGNAAPGTHYITINQLAQVHQLASQGFADTNTTSIGTGSVMIQVGSEEATTINIASGGDTLEGLRDAINASDAGVTATIINDGSASRPYRLLLTGNTTGAANVIDVTMNLSGGTAPDFVNNQIDAVEVGPGNSASYTGTAHSSGTYTGNQNQTFLVEIMSDGAVGAATFRFSTDGGVTFDDNGGAGYLTSEGGTLLEDGVSIAFSDSGALTTGDTFSIDTFVPTTQVAQDASITLGGASSNGAPITIKSASNNVNNLVPGVSLNLVGADPNTTVNISISNDTEAVRTAIDGFVEGYNTVIDFLNEQMSYDPMLEQGGLLLGDSLLVSVQNDLRRLATGVFSGLPSDMNRLSAIGITSVLETGRLVVDETKLSNALSSDLEGVANLFLGTTSSDNPDIVLLSGPNTAPSAGTQFEVDIINFVATSGQLQGGPINSGSGFPLTLTGSDNQLSLVVDGVESSVLTLTARSYSNNVGLGNEIQSQIDADPALAGVSVTVEIINEELVFTSGSTGSSSSVTLGTEPANSAFGILGLDGATATSGQGLTGTINGEPATAEGMVLTANEGNETTEGMSVLIRLGEGDLNPSGAEGVITFSQGLAVALKERLDGLTDPIDGRITGRTDRLTRQISELDEDIQRMDDLLEQRRLTLIDEYARLEASLASLSSQGEVLLQQLAGLSALTNKDND